MSRVRYHKEMRRLLVVLTLAACGGGATAGSGGDGAAGDARDRADGTGGGEPDAPAPDAPGVCTPTGAEVCDGADNDCNGKVDDHDAGADGFTDCARVAIFGISGGMTTGFQANLATVGVGSTRLQNTAESAALTAPILNAYDVIILDRLARPYEPDEATALSDWVGRGGALIVMSGYVIAPSDVDPQNQVLSVIGLALNPPLVDGPVTTFSTHPITTGLTSLEFRGGHVVRAVDGVTGGVNTPLGTIAGATIAMAQTRGAGRVVVWGDEWVSYDTQWATPSVQTFWKQTLAWAQHLD